MKKNVWKITAGLFVIVLTSVYYYSEVNNNWDALEAYTLHVKPGFLALALSLFVLAYLLDVYLWKTCLDRNKQSIQVGYIEIVSVIGISDMLRYIPGRIWGVASQYYLLKKYRISKTEVLYINLIGLIGSITISIYLCLVYFFLYSDFVSLKMAILILSVILSINIAYIFWNPICINKIIACLNLHLKSKLHSFFYSRGLIFKVQVIYLLSALFAGVAGYCLVRGFGLSISSGDILILLLSINISWLISHFVIVSPRGLGVREGTMLLMLNNVVPDETALLFPLLFRGLISTVDLVFVVVALCVVGNKGVFRGNQVEVNNVHGQG